MTTLRKLLSELKEVRKQKKYEPPFDQVISMIYMFMEDEKKQIITSYDAGYRCGKVLIDANGSDYYKYHFTHE